MRSNASSSCKPRSRGSSGSGPRSRPCSTPTPNSLRRSIRSTSCTAKLVRLVGDVDDLEMALRNLRVDPARSTATAAEAHARLVTELAAVGIEYDDGAQLEDLCSYAEQWIADSHAIDAHRQDLERDIEEAELEMAEARATLDRIETLGPHDDSRLASSTKVRSARAAIAEAVHGLPGTAPPSMRSPACWWCRPRRPRALAAHPRSTRRSSSCWSSRRRWSEPR